ncbi:MAG TPA: SDR family oxidoreductase [Dehalococcoidia bacterium]|nr:SDR family oxidoreductase [Dehalococcoidia bacterium]
MHRGNRHEVVMITGASAGVGRATARRFAREGASIGLIARGSTGLDGACRDVKDAGGRALPLETDVSDALAVEAAAVNLEAAFGPVDIWVNDAMTSVFSPVKEMTPDDFKRVTEVTYLGFVYGTLAALQRMLPRDRGHIVQVGSALAYRGIPLQAAYCASKHAIQGFTESLRCELLHDKSNVRLTMVQMPALNTPQFGPSKSRMPRRAQPVPPIYQPEVAAEAIYWAAHHDRPELWVGRSTVQAIQGNKIAPRLLDHYLARTGFESQQTPEPADPGRSNNLYAPLDGPRGADHGAHGAFDDRALGRSPELWATTHRGLLTAAAGGVAALALGAVAAKRRH